MIEFLTLVLFIILVVESGRWFGIYASISEVIRVISKSINTILSKRVSDRYKAILIRKYACILLKQTIFFISYLVTFILIAVLMEHFYPGLFIDPLNIAVTLILPTIYLYLRIKKVE